MLSRLVITFLPRSKHLLISWLQSPSAVILVMVHSLNFCLSVKLLISPSILSEILSSLSNLGCRFFSFSTLNISCHSLLTCRVSAERSAVNCMGFSLICYLLLFLAAFNILSLCLISVNLLNIHLDVILLGFIL